MTRSELILNKLFRKKDEQKKKQIKSFPMWKMFLDSNANTCRMKEYKM